MKLCNILVDNQIHLALVTSRGIVDATAAGFKLTMDQVIASHDLSQLLPIENSETLPTVADPVYANVVNCPGKLLCVGLNYRSHAQGINMQVPEYPVLFSKFANALAPSGAAVELPSWETSYDYEAELVIVIGKETWNVSEAQAKDCIFGYTCGNDFSLRDAQMRSGQWLIGKTLPGFGPCGPYIVTADSYDPDEPKRIKSYVNGQLRQDGSTADMLFKCSQIISYASKYIKLCPGDLIFTGTPSGVALEGEEKKWLKPGDVVDISIEGLGHLSNTLV
jgi:2-keto-4-pentenoate hydratase/2-oxohepta-3-ene-1,7-dioic acid hydratase in catechol pathway